MSADARPTLSTERLELRRFTTSDAEHLFRLDADPEVMRYITGGPGTPMETIRRQILPRFIREQDHAGVFGFWAAEQAGHFIGWFSLRQIEALPEQATLGYRLNRSAWGQGLATEGSGLLIERGFGTGGLQQIIATTYEDNLASIAVMTRLGMRFERRYRLSADDLTEIDTAAADPADAFPGDDVEYAIRRSDWLGERA